MYLGVSMLPTKLDLRYPLYHALYLRDCLVAAVEILRRAPKLHCIFYTQRDKILDDSAPENIKGKSADTVAISERNANE